MLAKIPLVLRVFTIVPRSHLQNWAASAIDLRSILQASITPVKQSNTVITCNYCLGLAGRAANKNIQRFCNALHPRHSFLAAALRVSGNEPRPRLWLRDWARRWWPACRARSRCRKRCDLKTKASWLRICTRIRTGLEGLEETAVNQSAKKRWKSMFSNPPLLVLHQFVPLPFRRVPLEVRGLSQPVLDQFNHGQTEPKSWEIGPVTINQIGRAVSLSKYFGQYELAPCSATCSVCYSFLQCSSHRYKL